MIESVQKSHRGNFLLFLLLKYFLLYASVLCLGIFLSQENLSINNSWILILLSCLLFAGHIIFTSHVFRGVISRSGIKIKNKAVSWHEVKSITRVYCFYFVRKTDGSFFVFPIGIFPIRILGDRISETDVDLLLRKMCDLHHVDFN